MITRENGDTLFAVKTHAGMCGTDVIEGVWAKDANEACSIMQDCKAEIDLWAEPWDDEVHPSEGPGGAKYSHEFAEE